ncbi:Hypothetical protein MSYG_4220 [Malassezia sympodialis ATCC 42132]|uniref:Uncharacterized protein n=1 Tax=Malassezia sympodialis (strain ATCC 42132) TaxID=1230383 RepID=A0A1M8ABQ5_MALS4|nr:Hypothetical protein MSYG_4220 [Malassezia sympodialis ATCC 42132]
MAATSPDTPLGRLAEALQTQTHAEELAEMQGMLASVKRALDSGRRVALPSEAGRPRGLPLWIVTKLLKSAWHRDGTWPLIGYDEAAKHSMCDRARCVVPYLHISQHAHALLVRNEAYEDGKRKGTILPCTQPPPPAWDVEPDADAIARAYAARVDL